MNENLDLGDIRRDLENMRAELQAQISEAEENSRAGTINPDRTDLAHSYDFGQRRSALIDWLADQLNLVENAIKRLEQGTYGKCTNCGRDISAGRLKAMPQASLCIRCQEQLERRS
jgi:RNA polymerase-binding protein DksA